jgi:DNA-binding CsgD family transcriptional regulator
VDEFSSLNEDGKKRLAARGIDLEQSYRDFQRAITAGEIPERLAAALSDSVEHPWKLNPREVAVLEYAAQGLSARETALALGVTPETVKSQAKTARMRLGARNTTHAVALAIVLGLLFQNGLDTTAAVR